MATSNVTTGKDATTRSNSTSYPPSYIREAKEDHRQTLILLHGRGGTGRMFGFEFLQSQTTSPSGQYTAPRNFAEHFPNMKFIFPTAKERRAKWYKGAVINQWFDNVPIDEQDDHGVTKEEEEWQVDGLRESRAVIMAIIEEEVSSVGAANVFFGGLSQGCAMSLHVLLSYEGTSNDATPLGGYVGMSGWLPYISTINDLLRPRTGDEGTNDTNNPFASGKGASDNEASTSQSIKAPNLSTAAQVCNLVRDNMELPPVTSPEPTYLKIPVYLGHGRNDERVKLVKGVKAAQCLRELGMAVTWKDYDEGHWYKEPEQIDDIVAFLQARLKMD